METKQGVTIEEVQAPSPRHLYRDEVIDDFIRNFLKKYNMTETLNLFQVKQKKLFLKKIRKNGMDCLKKERFMMTIWALLQMCMIKTNDYWKNVN